MLTREPSRAAWGVVALLVAFLGSALLFRSPWRPAVTARDGPILVDPAPPAQPVEVRAPGAGPGASRTEAGIASDAGPAHTHYGGHVTDRSGAPLEGAQVSRSDDAGAWSSLGVTDVHGRVALELPVEDPPPSSLSLRLECSGYLPAEITAYPGSSFHVVLQRLPAVTVRLVDETGRPVAGPARFTLEVHTDGGGDWNSTEISVDNGEYAFSDLPLGTLFRAWGRARGHVEVEDLEPRHLEPDQRLELELTVGPGFVVEGTVRDSVTQRALPGALVWADGPTYEEETSSLPGARADTSGRYRLDGVSAWSDKTVEGQRTVSLYLQASAEGYATDLRRTTRLPYQASGSYQHDILLEAQNVTLHARLLSPQGDGVGDTVVFAVDAQGGTRYCRSDPGGSFRLDDLAVGPVTVMASHRDFGPDALDLYVSARVEPSGDEVPIRMEAAAGTRIGGRLLTFDGSPLAAVPVEATLDFQSGGIAVTADVMRTTTDGAGNYEFLDVIPGRYTIDARSSERPCALPDARQVTLEPGARLDDIDFIVGDCVTFAGAARAARLPGSALEVVAREATTHEVVRRAPVSVDGTFRLEGLLAASYQLELVGGQEVLDVLSLGPSSADGLLLEERR